MADNEFPADKVAGDALAAVNDWNALKQVIIPNKNAGENITDRDAVFIDDTADEWLQSDANANTRYRFDGFALEAGSNGNAMMVQVAGVVGGFSALDIGKIYYVSDTAGAISTTPGTVAIPVGVAISATEILLHTFSYPITMGTGTRTNAAGAGTVAITCGFRPRLVLINGSVTNQGFSVGQADGVTNQCVYYESTDSCDTNTTNCIRCSPDGANGWIATVTLTATGFNLVLAEIGGGDAGTLTYTWTAIP